MGLFGDKKVYVASTVYNLAGDEEDRPDYLKTLVVSNVISNSRFSIPDTLTSGYMNGPGIKARSYHRWAVNHYEDIGVPTSRIRGANEFDMLAVQGEIPHDPADTVEILDVKLDYARYSFWAEQWMMLTHPELMGTAWTSTFNVDTDLLTITYADGTTEDVPIVMDRDKMYFYITYILKPDGGAITTRMWIYEIGTGNTVLDAIPRTDGNLGQFLPFIPVRIENEFLSSTYRSEEYELAKKAYRKATGQSFDKLVEKIADNESLDDIDHAYVMYGVPLNARDNSCRRYLYDFFEMMRVQQYHDQLAYDAWRHGLQIYENDQQSYENARTTYWGGFTVDQPIDEYDGSDPVYTMTAPYYPGAKPLTKFEYENPGTLETKLRLKISWATIIPISGTGLKKPDAKKGDYWVEVGTPYENGSGAIQYGNYLLNYYYQNDDVIDIYWQETDDSWRGLQIIGLKHENFIYKKEAVEISGKEALEDADESGFLVPIHYETMRQMSLVDSTQMMTASTFIVFNSYKIVKQKWYQTGIFKIFVFILIIAIAVFVPPIGGAMTAAYASIGAAIGLTGIAAVIAGAAISTLASMILMRILAVVSTAVLGEKFGAIFAAVAAVAITVMGPSLLNGHSLTAAWGNLMSANNLIHLSTALGDGIAQYIQASAMGVIEKTQDVIENYNEESKRISELYAQNIGYGRGSFDPMNLTDSLMGQFTESEAQFLLRTLMTGSDIAEMSLDMLTNFTEYTLNTDTSPS